MTRVHGVGTSPAHIARSASGLHANINPRSHDSDGNVVRHSFSSAQYSAWPFTSLRLLTHTPPPRRVSDFDRSSSIYLSRLLSMFHILSSSVCLKHLLSLLHSVDRKLPVSYFFIRIDLGSLITHFPFIHERDQRNTAPSL
jgi:hypothetical protein